MTTTTLHRAAAADTQGVRALAGALRGHGSTDHTVEDLGGLNMALVAPTFEGGHIVATTAGHRDTFLVCLYGPGAWEAGDDADESMVLHERYATEQFLAWGVPDQHGCAEAASYGATPAQAAESCKRCTWHASRR